MYLLDVMKENCRTVASKANKVISQILFRYLSDKINFCVFSLVQCKDFVWNRIVRAPMKLLVFLKTKFEILVKFSIFSAPKWKLCTISMATFIKVTANSNDMIMFFVHWIRSLTRIDNSRRKIALLSKSMRVGMIFNEFLGIWNNLFIFREKFSLSEYYHAKIKFDFLKIPL